MAEKDRPEAEWPSLVSKYIEISRPAANKLVDEFYRDGTSFVFLDIDAKEFSISQKTQGKLGVVHAASQSDRLPRAGEMHSGGVGWRATAHRL